ncbi:hypothetical protein ACELLULO517_26965 [Acidisoma cellulosilytica]|uniref:Uncharacterized protein n=1 Tax=Acidisoma cellulosilyticum TaxID=2802395 RepID=A0A963Z8P7_9PROT|nr:hypothetical protein [Acidisoma cellulosilyticum]MCB8883917.1 hypothetical protein [Acidisoma cellulosilyticum]
MPWRVDGAHIEDDIFNLAVSQAKSVRSPTVKDSCLLALQFRERAEERAARATALMGQSTACRRARLFDLSTLLPVPADLLLYELTHPKARAWLLDHWGLSDLPLHAT